MNAGTVALILASIDSTLTLIVLLVLMRFYGHVKRNGAAPDKEEG